MVTSESAGCALLVGPMTIMQFLILNLFISIIDVFCDYPCQCQELCQGAHPEHREADCGDETCCCPLHM